MAKRFVFSPRTRFLVAAAFAALVLCASRAGEISISDDTILPRGNITQAIFTYRCQPGYPARTPRAGACLEYQFADGGFCGSSAYGYCPDTVAATTEIPISDLSPWAGPPGFPSVVHEASVINRARGLRTVGP